MANEKAGVELAAGALVAVLDRPAKEKAGFGASAVGWTSAGLPNVKAG